MSRSHKVLDVLSHPEQRRLLMADTFNMSRCPHCNHPAWVHRPFILWEKHFAAIVLSERQKAEHAAAIIALLLHETVPSRKNRPREVIVFSKLAKLQKALVNPLLTRIRVPIEILLQRDWYVVKEPVVELAGALVQRGMPERAFLMYAELVGIIPELYAHPEIRKGLELAATAAGSHIVDEQSDKRTPLEQLRDLDAQLSRLAFRAPFLEHYQVSYCPIDEKEEMELDPYIISNPVGPEELARGLLLVHVFTSFALKWIPDNSPAILLSAKLARIHFSLQWERMDPRAHADLRAWFRDLSGADIQLDKSS